MHGLTVLFTRRGEILDVLAQYIALVQHSRAVMFDGGDEAEGVDAEEVGLFLVWLEGSQRSHLGSNRSSIGWRRRS